jgi:hypothetical protein
MVQALQRESGFGKSQYRQHQIYFVNEFSRRELNQELSTCQLSRAFGYDGARIKAALVNVLNDLKIRRCHLAFDNDSESEILE